MRWRTCLALTTVFMALEAAPARAQAGTAAADTREVQAYRLTMPKLNQLNQVMADVRRQRETDPAYRRRLAMKKELATLGEKDDPTDADRERMDQLERQIEEGDQAEDEAGDEEQSLSAMAQRMAADPRIAGALKRANLAPREAATIELALLQVAFAVGMQESGAIKEIPKDVNPDNVRFYKANRAAIEALTALRTEDD